MMKTRAAKVNQARDLLTEHGIVMAKSIHQCRRALPVLLEDADNGLSMTFRGLLSDFYVGWVRLG